MDPVLDVEAQLLAPILDDAHQLAAQALELQLLGDHRVELYLGRPERDALDVELVADDGRDVVRQRVAENGYPRQRLAHLESGGVSSGEPCLHRLPGPSHVGLDLRIVGRHRLGKIGQVHRFAVRQVAMHGVGHERRKGSHQQGQRGQGLVQRLIGRLLVAV